MLGMMRNAVRETAIFVGLAALLAVAAVFAFFELPEMVVSPDDLLQKIPPPAGSSPAPAPTGFDLVQARNGARTAGVALIAGVGAALAAGFSARTFYLTRRTQALDRHAKSVERLANAEDAVRVAAVTELGQIAAEI